MTCYVKDAIGQTLYPGEEVAYVSRQGSKVNIERRRIAQVRIAGDWNGHEYEEVSFAGTGRNVWARAYNCVRVEPEEGLY